MKCFLPFVTGLSLAAGSFAQNARIVSPVPMTNIQAGSEVTLRVEANLIVFGSGNPMANGNGKQDEKKWPVGSVEHVGLALGLQSCETGKGCQPVDKEFGTLLYKGAFEPKDDGGGEGPHEEFKVQIPDDFPKGTAVFGSLHLVVYGLEDDRTSNYSKSEVRVNIV
ncbi:hypothetical protein MPER_13129 [Moniliophthora perniciosa FA553]|nr:hypothetical protein MPER_13129 [Moniliophthora perniciosa FA553]